jgi:hypothetical protein
LGIAMHQRQDKTHGSGSIDWIVNYIIYIINPG